MEALEARCSNLEQQLTQVLNHLGSTTGDLFASHSQVSKLEAIVKQQQHTIDNLEATHTFFQKQLPDYIDEQLQQAIHQRGSRGPDYINITKFINKKT
jgi:septal ring factor EnvC (AmiA/AmiB activator)